MRRIAPTAARNTPGSAEELVRQLGRRYRFVLVTVALLMIVDQAVLQPLLVQLNFYAPVINVAGRQRMLSQKVTKAALALQVTSRESGVRMRQHELLAALRQWTVAHHGLVSGNRDLGLPGTDSPEILAAFAELEPHFNAIHAAASRLVDQPASSLTPATVDDILTHEAQYLPIMDRVVGLFEYESRQQVAWLRLIGVTLTLLVILLLFGVGYFVLGPATNAIRQQVQALAVARNQLEVRVDQRTRELVEANQALEHEIAERRQAETRTRELSSQLAHASRVTTIGQLATGLAHELNQPLSAIANYAHACQLMLAGAAANGMADEEAASAAAGLEATVGKIRQAALRAGEIIRRMRNFLRPTAAAPAYVDMADLLAEVSELCRHEIASADVTLKIEVGSDLPRVCVDAIRIQQVVVNLLHNALQALRDVEWQQRQLEFHCHRDGPYVRIDVLDSGPGFPDQDPDRLFAPFHSTKAEGLGMGLAISRTIVQEHRGRLWAENRPEGGARVSFCLPVQSAKESHAA